MNERKEKVGSLFARNTISLWQCYITGGKLNENHMQIKLAIMESWHPIIRKIPFSKGSLEFHHRPKAAESPVHAWVWWELHGNCTKHKQAVQLILIWHFSHGKSSTIFASSSSWNLNLLSFIFMYIHIYTHSLCNLKGHNSCIYLTKTGKRRTIPCVKD